MKDTAHWSRFLLPVLIFNVMMAQADETEDDLDRDEISAEFPYESRYVEVKDIQMHYVEKGEGGPILFLHGNPTSSYLWRNIIPHAAEVGRAIAVDLAGFGKSGKPDMDYTYQDHLPYVEGFIEALDLKNITLVLHDWGSVLGLDYASRHEDNVQGVILMEPIIPPAFPMESFSEMGEAEELFRRFRDPEEGKALIIDQNFFVENLLGNATVTRKMTEAEMDHYRRPFEEPGTRLPVYMWPNELPIEGVPARNVKVIERVGAWLEETALPKLLFHGRPGAIAGPEEAQWMADHYPNLDIIFVGPGRHYLQEDHPEVIGRNIAHWYQRHIRQ